MLVEVGAVIRDNPGRFIFSNVGGGLPMEAVMSRDSKSADGNRWPSAAAINALLEKWHQAKEQMEGAWQSIPQDRKGGLVPPPTLRYR